MTHKILCPKCRALGSHTDCSDQLLMPTNRDHTDRGGDDDYELEVTIRFAVPVTSTIPMDPHEMATHQRDQWIDSPNQLIDIVATALDDDVDLTVRPLFVP